MFKSKYLIISEIFQYSHNYGMLLNDCEDLYNGGYGESSVLLLFNLLENTIKSNTKCPSQKNWIGNIGTKKENYECNLANFAGVILRRVGILKLL